VRQVHRIIKNPPCGGSGLFAAQRWPAFDAFVVVSFPIGKIGSDAKERFNIECEIRSVFEHNPDYVVVVHCRDFDSLNDFATDNSERVWFASLAGTYTLGSHESPFERRGFVVRAALVLRTLTRPVSLVLAYAREGSNKKEAKIPVTARKIMTQNNMCVKYIVTHLIPVWRRFIPSRHNVWHPKPPQPGLEPVLLLD
jgi:hypothetical protein